MRDRIDAWRNAFEVDENSVQKALSEYAWNYAAYMTIVRFVEASPTDENGEKPLNSLIFGLISSSYWSNTLLAIRRLSDPSPLNGVRGVCSIASILADIKACRSRLTRRVYLEIANLEYDYAETERQYWEFVRMQVGPTFIPKGLQYDLSQNRHAQFDFLSGVPHDQRSEDDLVRAEIFDAFDARLAKLNRVADHATVNFAHAATEVSRQGRIINRWGTKEAREALQLLTETAELLGRWFLNSGVGDVLPIPQFDQFKHLEKPLIAPELFPALQEQWDDFAEQTANWPHIADNSI